MSKVIVWLVVFLIVYLIYLFFVVLRKKKRKNLPKNTYINYLIKFYKLDQEKINLKVLIHIVSLANAFIISTTFIIIGFIKNFVLMMLLAFVVLIPLQLLVYHIIGKTLKRREKNV